MKKVAPIHPGEILKDTFEEAGIKANAAALAMRIPASRLTAILHGKRSITADTALRLGRLFNTSALMWLNLQSTYDLQVAEDASGRQIAKDVVALSVSD